MILLSPNQLKNEYFIIVSEIIYSIQQLYVVTITLYIYPITTIIYYIIFYHTFLSPVRMQLHPSHLGIPSYAQFSTGLRVRWILKN